jgi:hypothetical protein
MQTIMEEKKNQNINFFKKIWYSITKFDKYPEMATEGLRNAIKYLVIMVAIVTVFLVISSIIEVNKLVASLADYIENNMPEFSYENGNIITDQQEPIILSDIKYNGIAKVAIYPQIETPEQKLQVKEENDMNGTTIFFFKNQIILQTRSEGKETKEQPYTYDDFLKNYTQENIKEFNKAQMVEYMRSTQMYSYYMKYGTSLTIYLFIANVLVALLDTLELAILGWITASIGKIKMKLKAIYSMAVYSLTLSMILNMVYIIINYFTKFTISYFQVAYITIAYVYLAAAIFILKDDFMKKQQEVEKIKKEQEKVKEEFLQPEKEPDTEKKEKEKEKKKEEDNNNEQEPKGLEA